MARAMLELGAFGHESARCRRPQCSWPGRSATASSANSGRPASRRRWAGKTGPGRAAPSTRPVPACSTAARTIPAPAPPRARPQSTHHQQHGRKLCYVRSHGGNHSFRERVHVRGESLDRHPGPEPKCRCRSHPHQPYRWRGTTGARDGQSRQDRRQDRHQADAAPRQPLLEPLAGPRQPAEDGVLLDAEPIGRLRPTEPFETAQHKDAAIDRRQLAV